MNWTNLIGKQDIILTLFISLIQLKNWTNYKILFREIWLFIKLRPKNLLRIDFWMFSLIAILTPKFILRPFTNWYKHRINRNFVKIIERPKEK